MGTTENPLQKLVANKAALGGAVAGLVGLIIAIVFLWPDGDDQADGEKRRGQQENIAADGSSTADLPPNPRDVPLPADQTGRCRIYTAESGYSVLVGSEPLRDVAGKMVRTPCEVAVRAGVHTITVFREGRQDQFREVKVTGETEVVFESDSQAEDQTSSILSAPYFELKTGQPVSLDSLNTAGQELDPYVTPDGLVIYFVGDRSGGTGVFWAARESIYHEFDEPQLLALSEDRDLAASPSITGDSLSVVYAVPGKRQIWALTRTSPLAGFDSKTALRFSPKSSGSWQSVQMLYDGLRMYWVEKDQQAVRTLVSTRKKIDHEFGEPRKVTFPGTHPCLSQDGLRQYVFDGKTLSRYRRAKITATFSQSEQLAGKLGLPSYTADENRRQFFVSADEQWLFYAVKTGRGDLKMVRLSDGRAWGEIPLGKPIPPRQIVVETKPKATDNTPTVDKPPEKPVDPRTLPLPYTAYWKEFTAHIDKREYAKAAALNARARNDSKFVGDRNLLAWDRADIARLQQFDKSLQEVMAQLKPGDEVSIGSAKIPFVRYENGEIVARTKNGEVRKPIRTMRPSNLVAIIDRFVKAEDKDSQYAIGTFLFYDPQGNRQRAATRFGRAQGEAAEFVERFAERTLHQARAEFERRNIAAGLEFGRAVVAEFPSTKTADKARQLEQEAYQFTKWRQTGGRKWQVSAEDEYTADPKRSQNSYLMSPEQYENFELRVEWKTTGRTGQGGVFFRYSGQGSPYNNAYKLQVSNDYGIAPDSYSTGSLFAVSPPDENTVLPSGQWNTLILRVEGESVEATINGKKVLETLAQNDRAPKKGYVALDGVGGGISYRKTLLVELPATGE